MLTIDEADSAMMSGPRTRPLSMPSIARQLLGPVFGVEGFGAHAVLSLLRLICGDTTTVTVRGKPFNLDLRDTGVSFHLLVMRWYESSETAFFQRLLSPGDSVIDVGANIGYFSTLFAELVGPTGKVLAFEPDPRSSSILETNLHARGLQSRVEIVRAAVGAESGNTKLYTYECGNRGDHRVYDVPSEDDAEICKGRSRVPIDVPMLRVDDLTESWPRLDAVKMDIQGFEGYALAGMRRLRARFPDAVILTEYWPSALRQAGSDPREVLAELRRTGGVVYELNPQGGVAIFDEIGLLPFLEHTKRSMNLVIGRPERIEPVARCE